MPKTKKRCSIVRSECTIIAKQHLKNEGQRSNQTYGDPAFPCRGEKKWNHPACCEEVKKGETKAQSSKPKEVSVKVIGKRAESRERRIGNKEPISKASRCRDQHFSLQQHEPHLGISLNGRTGTGVCLIFSGAELYP